MKRAPDMNVEVPGRWEAETEARLIEFVKNIRTAESETAAVRLFTEWLQKSHSQEMRNTGNEDIAKTTARIRAAGTDEEATEELRSRYAALTGDRLYGEIADMSEGHGVGTE